MQELKRLEHFPIAFFTCVMGLAGLSLAWREAGKMMPLTVNPSALIAIVSALVFTLLSLMHLLKYARHRSAVIAELDHPVKSKFFSAITISIVLLSAIALPYSYALAISLFITGALIHLLLTFWVFNRWMFSTHYQNEHINPAWFVPVVGNVLMPIVAVPLGLEEVGWFFFSIGIVFWMVLFTIFMHRIFFFDPLPPMLTPMLFILIAPPAVGFNAYLALNGFVDNFSQVLYGIALFITLFLFSQFRRFSRLPFFLSWWAYAFPLAAMTIASFQYFEQTRYAPVRWIALVLLALLSAIVMSLLVRTFIAIKRRGICIPDS